MAKYIRRKPLSPKQAQVMRIVRAGGCLRLMPGDPVKGRVLDAKRSPVMNIQLRTFNALRAEKRIKFEKEILSWTYNNKRILNPYYQHVYEK